MQQLLTSIATKSIAQHSTEETEEGNEGKTTSDSIRSNSSKTIIDEHESQERETDIFQWEPCGLLQLFRKGLVTCLDTMDEVYSDMSVSGSTVVVTWLGIGTAGGEVLLVRYTPYSNVNKHMSKYLNICYDGREEWEWGLV